MNGSEEYTVETKWELLRHSLYLVQAFCIILFNSLIVATVARHKALRDTKEYLSLAALAFIDAAHAVGTEAAAIYRIPVWLWNLDKDPASPRFCLLKVHNILWALFDIGCYAMLVVVSIDRLLSITIPLRHMALSRRYMLGMVSVAYGISILCGVTVYAMNWGITEPIRTKVCWSSEAYGMLGSYIVDGGSAVFILLSIVIYCFVPISYACRNNAVAPAGNSRAQQNYRFQKQLNKAVSISCMFTFVFVALPWMGHLWLLENNPNNYEWYSVWMFIIADMNPMLNLGIYYRKQYHFKIGLKALFQNKTMPGQLDSWEQNRMALIRRNGRRSNAKSQA